MSERWSVQFEIIVKRHLNINSGPLSAQVTLPQMGLDSLGLVALIEELEQHYQFEFPFDQMTPDLFESPGVLWEAIRQSSTVAQHERPAGERARADGA